MRLLRVALGLWAFAAVLGVVATWVSALGLSEKFAVTACIALAAAFPLAAAGSAAEVGR